MDALVVLVLIIAIFIGGYFLGKKRQRVTAIGRDTYVRFYPNPGIGISLFNRLFSISVVGGLEYYRGVKLYSGGRYVGRVWERRWYKFSRIKGIKK